MDDDVQSGKVDFEFVCEAWDRVPVSDIEDHGLHPWIRGRGFVEQFFTAACDDHLVPLSVKSFCKRAANAGTPACNQNCIAGDLHDRSPGFDRMMNTNHWEVGT